MMCHYAKGTWTCLLYTSDAADERSSVDLGGRRIIKKKKKEEYSEHEIIEQKHKQIETNRKNKRKTIK